MVTDENVKKTNRKTNYSNGKLGVKYALFYYFVSPHNVSP